MKILIDTCVVVDVLQKREPFCKDAMDVFLAVSNNQCIGVLTAKSITDIYYILRRSIHDEGVVRNAVSALFKLFEVADTFAADCQLAIAAEMKDYEDAIMVETAKRIAADYIITRNIKDYQDSKVPAFLPKDFIRLLKNTFA